MAFPKEVVPGSIDWDYGYRLESNILRSKEYRLSILEEQLMEIGFDKNDFGVQFNHHGYTICFKRNISPSIRAIIESKGYRVIINHAKN